MHTDMVTSVVLVDLRIHSSTASLGSLWAGMTMTFGGGADSRVYPGTICIPPLVRMGLVVSATVYRRKASPCVRPRMWTFSNTSHGPAKSMTTAPSEMRKATGMAPSAGGWSGFGTGPGSLAASVRDGAVAIITPKAAVL